MGKITSQRQKFHLAARGEPKKKHISPVNEVIGDGSHVSPSPVANVFTGVNITLDMLNVPKDHDNQSVSSLLSRKEMRAEEKYLSKKEKLKLRRSKFLKKIEVIQEAMHEWKAKKKRKTTAVVGDLQPLIQSLPTITATDRNEAKKDKTVRKAKGIRKLKQRLKLHANDIKMMRRVYNDSLFQQNASAVISEYVKQKVEEERKKFS